MINKRGITLLAENIIFIILNLIFISLLIVFLFSKTSSIGVLEEKYAKEIALIIDSARPGMMVSLNMDDAVLEAENELGRRPESLVNINENLVTVKIGEKGGYSYSFFNDINLSKPYLDSENNYIFYFGGYNE